MNPESLNNYKRFWKQDDQFIISRYFNFEPSFKPVRPSGCGNYFICKIFAVQTLLWSLKFVTQINIEYATITVWNLARSCGILT